MKVSFQKGDLATLDVEILVAAVYAPAEKKTAAKTAKKGQKKRKTAFLLPENLVSVDKALNGQLVKAAQAEEFTGKAGTVFSMHSHGLLPSRRVVLVGLGSSDAVELETLRKAGGQSIAVANKAKASTAHLALPAFDTLSDTTAAQAAAEGLGLAAYRFDKYLSEDTDPPTAKKFSLSLEGIAPVAARKSLKRAQSVVDGVCLARDLVNEPPGTLTPVEFAKRARTVGKTANLTVSVMDERALAREKMNMLLAVAQAAAPYTPPRVVRLAYRPKKKAKRHVVLVGKGLTFDSGGLDLKPAAGMLDMKMDMGGAGAVLGTMLSVGQIAPDIAVTGYLACVENGIGGNAYHPSDILLSRKGLTVEVNNTDAEGRLVLADTIDLALSKDKPDMIIDLATLTGACMVALGPTTAGIFTDDDELAEDIRGAGKRAGEDFWRLPLNDELAGQLKSNLADTKNTGERWGGAITAGLFLKRFVDDRAKWAHIDIAGPTMTNKGNSYTPRGGVGFPVRTLTNLLCR
jgi:leucyl aminopeptidase